MLERRHVLWLREALNVILCLCDDRIGHILIQQEVIYLLVGSRRRFFTISQPAVLLTRTIITETSV